MPGPQRARSAIVSNVLYRIECVVSYRIECTVSYRVYRIVRTSTPAVGGEVNGSLQSGTPYPSTGSILLRCAVPSIPSRPGSWMLYVCVYSISSGGPAHAVRSDGRAYGSRGHNGGRAGDPWWEKRLRM